jgi:transcriptional regulator with XRE-family HTH domain
MCSNAIVDDLVSAIKALRSVEDEHSRRAYWPDGHQGETQQAFATRLGISLRALANYEAGQRRPPPEILERLIDLAVFRDRQDLAKKFADAYARDLKGRLEPITDVERAWVGIILAVVRNRRWLPDWKRVAEDIMNLVLSLENRAGQGEPVKSDPGEFMSFLEALSTPRAAEEVRQLALARSRKTGESLNQAQLKVLFDRPDLYAKCQRERDEWIDEGEAFPKLEESGKRRKRK